MNTVIDNLSYGSSWQDIHTDFYEGYAPNMSDFHMHKYFEISIIISGNVNILLKDSCESSTDSKIILLKPFTPHYINCEPDVLYKRRNILFSRDFIVNYVPEWEIFSRIFKDNGSVSKISKEQCDVYIEIADKIDREVNRFRKRLLLLELLSILSENIIEEAQYLKLPIYISDSLDYINKNYNEKIISDDIAKKYGVGRTTYLTAFKKYTGCTLNEYINRTRLKYAIAGLQKGFTEQQVAESCGFGDACNLIRCSKRCLGLTPKKYIASIYKK